MTRTIFKSRRSRTSCSLVALATVLAVGASPAAAQSLLGTGTYVTNPVAGGITTPNGTTTNIALNGGNTIINWTPTDNASGTGTNILFQPAGTTANFTASSNFAVLNRIMVNDATRAIVMNGTVNGLVGGNQGGSIYFYSPGGFVFGNGSVFNLASLVVTTLEISDASFANVGATGYGNVTFGQAQTTGASISMNGTVNAFVPALGFGGAAGPGYVAMIAPRVVHNGVITANGSTALVAAEAATINFSPDGLFDIEVTVGTTSTSGVEVYGDITGPTPTGVSDKQGIYLVAVPKNDALTMVIGGGADLGFTLANTAVDDNGVIILSAGHDIVDGTIGDRSAGHGANATANFWFTGAHATNNLFGEATGYADLYSTDGQASQLTTIFDNNVTVHAVEHVWMNAAGAGATLTAHGDVSLSTDRFATEAGGSATGGQTSLYALNGGSVVIEGDLSMTADGFGADSGDSVAAGNGTGGNVSLSVSDGSTLTIGNVETGNVYLSASGTGGTGYEGGSGNGTGGTISIQASTDGDLAILGDTDAYAEGRGGTNWDASAIGGTGQGGDIFVNASGAGSTLSLTGALMSANGIGGGAGEGTCCAAVGGAGIGGLVSVFGSNGALIQSNGTLEFSAAGEGGLASGAGGSGSGGADGNGVFVTAQEGLTLNVTGNLWLDATGSGGDGEDAGGAGTGGHALLNVQGGTVNVSGEVNVDADGFGGDSYFGGNGGTGTGGLAEMATNGVTAQLNVVNALIEADGTGGNSYNFNEGPLGDGGDALGGRTRASANDGTIHITGDLTMKATASGGSGANGGDATGIVTPSNNEGLPPAAFLWAQAATGELRVDGLTDIDVSATGGEGFDGNGGNASAGEVDIASRDGDVLLGDVIANADAFGGNGSYGGGAGGNAVGGAIDVNWAVDQSTGLSGLISLETVALSANGTGGNGGEGLFVQAGPGGTGGAGGNGTGGFITYNGSAGGGTLDVGSTTIEANGIGGNGGNGGSGDTGGNGGAGGIGTGGFIQTGTISNTPSPTPGGGATFTFLSASASASGGAGGNGGEGFSGLGMGGNGGDAIGGQASFLVRGVVVTADSINLFANATGGDAGSGALAGNGGDAFTGFVSVESKDRFGHETQRGSLIANTINGTAIAQGGNGATDGTSTVRGGSYFRVLNGDADIGSMSFTFAGDLYDGTTLYNDTIGPNYIQAQDGTATIGTFDYSTTGELAIYTTETGSMDVGDLTLSAGNFIDHPTLVGPASPGTIFATNLSVTSGGDFIADAHLDVDNEIDISVPGSIRFADATSGWYVNLWADSGSIQVGDVNAPSSVSLAAGSFIQGGDINAGGSIYGFANGGSIELGDLTSTFGSITLFANNDINLFGDALADGDILLTAGGNIVLNNATAGESIEIDAGGYFDEGGGYVDGLDLTAGDSIEVVAAEWVDLGDLSAGLVDPSFNEGADYVAAILAGGNIVTGNIAAAQHIGLATPGTMTTGTIDAGGIFMALGTGDMSFGDASAGSEVYIADFSMMELGGTVTEEFDPAPILASAPTPTGGSIAITGPLTASSFVTAAAGTNLNFTTIGAGGYVDLQAGNNITGTSITADGSISLHAIAGDISLGSATSSFASIMMDAGDDIYLTGNLLADGDILLTAGGDIAMKNATGGFFRADALGGTFTADNITSNADIRIFAEDDVTAGDLSAGLPVGESSKALRIDTNGSVVVGNMSALGGIDVTADGSVTGLNVTTGDVLITEANGAITYDNISAGLVNPQPATEPASVVLDSATSIAVGNVDAAGTVGFLTSGTLTAGNVTTGADLLGLVHGNIAIGDITADGRVLVADSSMFTDAGGAIGNFGDDEVDIESIFTATPVRTNGSITVGNVLAGSFTASAGTSLTTGIIDTDSEIGLGATGAITTGNLFAGDFVLANGGSITTGSIDADSVAMESTGGNITIGGDVTAGGTVELDAFGNILTDNITAGTIALAAGGTITTDNLTTELPLLLAQAVPDPDEEGNITLIAGGNILTGDISAAQNILLATPGTITGQTIDAGGMFMALAHGDMSFGDATAGEVFLADYAMLTLGGDFSATCIGNCGTLGPDGVVIASPSGLTYLYVTTEGGVSGAGQLPGEGGTNGSLYTTSAFSAAAGDDLEFWFNYVTSDGSGFADYSWAALLTTDLDPVAILFTARTQPTGTIVPGQDLPGVEATLNPSTVPIIAGAPEWSPLGSSSSTCYDAGCGFTGWVSSTYEIAAAGNYVLAFGVSNWSDTSYQSGMAFSGITIGGVPVQTAPIRTGGSISIGNVVTGSFTGAAGTDLTAGIINSTGGISLGANGAINTANLFAGTFVLADGGSVTTGNIDAGSVDMASTNGNITIGNIVAGGDVDLDASGNLSAQAITADDIEARASGTAIVNGAWNAGNVRLTSNDIDITADGSIDAADLLTLVSTNATQALIGDGLTGSGYALSDAEFGRLQGGSLHILARGDASAAQDMLIGNLTVTGPGAGGTIDSSEGILVFGVGDANSESVNGVIRVNGNVAATGFGSSNAIEFYADRFELNAATGSVSILSSGSTLGGELGIYADQIHVAAGSILDQLAANPTYTGYQEDLNEAASVQRPEGVLRADTLWIESDNLQSVLIQNTGTFETRAGFLVREAYINEDDEVAGPPGSINLVVNGQVVTEGGTLTGVDARDALVDEETDITPFTSNSTINGCPLTGQCIIAPPPPPPTANLVENQIDLIGRNPIGEGEFEDNQEGEEGSSNPIAPPQPLFDTRPLVPTGDVDDPVSGTGNPALLGSESQCEEEENGQCAAPVDGDGQ